MKKFTKVFILVVLICSILSVAVACEGSTLKTPKDLEITGDTVSWGLNEKAEQYGVVVGENKEVYTKKNYFAIVVDEIGDYPVKVRAMGGDKYKDSDYSAAIVYKKTKRLTSPQNVRVEGNKLVWDAVTNASKYVVTLKRDTDEGDKKFDVNNTEFVIEGDDFRAPAVYNFAVLAVGDGDKFYDSLSSENCDYIVTQVLATPEIKLDGNYIRWTSITNAQKYRVAIIGNGINDVYIQNGGTNTSLNFASTDFSNKLTAVGDYEIKVTAFVENSPVFLESANSNSVTLKKLDKPSDAKINGDNLEWVNAAQDAKCEIEFSAKTKTGLSTAGLSKVVTDENNSTTYDYTKNTALYGDANGGKIYSFKIRTYGQTTRSNGDGSSYSTGEISSDFVDVKVSGADKVAQVYTYNKELAVDEEGWYNIGSPYDFAYIYFNSNTESGAKKFKLKSNIDFKQYCILSIENFVGTFDGAGYHLSNFAITQGEGITLGLFSEIANEAIVSNTNIIDGYIYTNNESAYVGMLTGINNGKIENCAVSGAVHSVKGFAGGLVGENTGSIKSSTSNVYVEASVKAGGITAVNKNATSEIVSSASYGSVKSNYVRSNSIESNEVMAGGLVAENNGIIKSSFSIGSVFGGVTTSASVAHYVGGISGYNSGTIINSYATGSVGASVSKIGKIEIGSYIAGFVGFATNTSLISDSYAMGRVDAQDCVVAGFVNRNDGKISNSFASFNGERDNLTGKEKFAFAYLGEEDSFVNCYYNTQINQQGGVSIPATSTGSKATIVGKTKAEMRVAAFATALGSGFVYNSAVSERAPILSKMFYFSGTTGATNASLNQSSNPFEPNYATYFGAEKIAETKMNVSSKGYFYHTYTKVVDEETFTLARYYRVK